MTSSEANYTSRPPNSGNEQKQIRILDFLYAFRKHYLLIVICAIIGLAVGIALSILSYMRGELAKRYAISSSIAVISQNESGMFTSASKEPGERDLYLAEEMVDSVIYVIKSDKMLNAAIERLNLVGVSTKDIYDNLELKQYNETQIIEMTLYWRSAQEGILILNAISDVSADILIETLKIGNVSVVNEPKSKYLIGGNINASLWLYLMVLGACLGAGIAILDLLLRPTLLDTGDMEKYFKLEQIGEIPENKSFFKKHKKVILYDDDENIDYRIVDNYVSIAHIVKNKVRTIENPFVYVTSSSQNEGKTTVTANLGVQLSETGLKVLIIDLDTRNPSLGSMFLDKVDYEHSLNALYRGEVVSDESITHITGQLDILPAVLERRPLPVDTALLGLLSNLGSKYDIVLLDTAPVGQVADTMALNHFADTAIFVVRFDGAQMEVIRDSISRLEKSDMKILGCVINAVKNIGAARKYSYKYGYYYSKGNQKKKQRSEQFKEWEKWERKHAAIEDSVNNKEKTEEKKEADK